MRRVLPGRPRSPGGPGAASVLTAAGTRCLSLPARGRPMSERGRRGDATRPWLLRRNSAVFLPPSLSPSLSGLRSPAGAGTLRGPIGAAGPGSGRGGTRREAGGQPLSCGAGGARPGRAGPGPAPAVELPRSRGWLGGWCEEEKGEAGHLRSTPPALAPQGRP